MRMEGRMVKDAPLLVLSSSVCIYWITVVFLALYQWLRHGQGAGFLPRQAMERRLWVLLVPMVIAWIAFPVLSHRGTFSWLALQPWARSAALVYGVRWVAASLAVAAYGLSLYCWLLLGRDWSMAVIPERQSRLVTTGLYGWVRHPIYSLSMLLMLSSVIVLPVAAMVLVAAIHFLVMHQKARNEERHLHARFGGVYTTYCRAVGRFCPRW
jgi:protein-S-isoprenylcysteine O-methyltransferase Ste14